MKIKYKTVEEFHVEQEIDLSHVLYIIVGNCELRITEASGALHISGNAPIVIKPIASNVITVK